MTASGIISLGVFCLTSALMLGIGISQLRSKTPVGFYSGEKPPKAEELTDVEAWNRKHGMMWIIYGVVILASWFVGTLVGDSVWCIVPICGGLVVPVIVMIRYHRRLIRTYKKK